MKKIHIVVATGEWENDGLRYRRHRLAEFLQQQADTKEVIWVCPSPNRKGVSAKTLSNGIGQWSVQDLLPNKMFRFGRYMDGFYKSKLLPFLSYLKKFKGQYTINLWYTFPGFPLLSDLFPWDRVIYDCSDLWASPMNGKSSVVSTLRQNIIAKAENRIIQRADTIFCTSEYLRDQMIEKTGSTQKVFTFENGVEFELFASEHTQVKHVLPENFNGTVLGFIGGIKPKLDFELIQQVARKKREWLFLFVGPDGTNQDSDFKKLLTEQNVLWTGSVSPADVPKYMNLIDIGIMPYKPSQYNQAVFPLKLFEFLAAGKPVVGINLPSTKKYVQESVYSYIANNQPSEFIYECEKLAGDKNQDNNMLIRKQIAKAKNWSDVFESMLSCV
ncbi:glycosyltransferase [Neobacillus cucumis]|uniref:teichuronic acid biosynthesis protein TuaH n=1 Tax=Neobacillus cucumis TaxID=1740721 RepID=UPI0018E03808|nr:glycosyltransferase [Neobacillus cucumis]MBI0579349.1 glycosyltransferase [Neobacillus cucumis]